jgi:hypothetical protein
VPLDIAAIAQLDGRLLDPSIRRVWPPTPGTAPGASLGFLRYLSRDPGVALEVKTGKGYWLMLDPAVTAPNATLGVHLGGSQPGPRSSWHFMQPGDVLYQPGGFDRAWVYNADMLDRVLGGLPVAAARPVGYAGFLVGKYRNVGAPTRSGPLPFARLCGVGRMATSAIIVPAGAMRRVVVELLPVSAGGAIVLSNWTVRMALVPMYRIPASTAATGLDEETWDTPSNDASANGPIESPSLHGEAGGIVFEVPVEGMHHIAIGVATQTTWAGVAVADVVAQVEGVP